MHPMRSTLGSLLTVTDGMADPEGTRKLEAILAAVVAGCSRLMQTTSPP